MNNGASLVFATHLFVWIRFDFAIRTLLSRIRPRIGRCPWSFTITTFEFTECTFRPLIRRQFSHRWLRITMVFLFSHFRKMAAVESFTHGTIECDHFASIDDGGLKNPTHSVSDRTDDKCDEIVLV